MKIKWLTRALKNLNDEATYIEQDDPAAARLAVQHIHSSVNLLPDNPALGRPGRILGTRELIVPNTRYIIPYRVRPKLNRIEILRIFHASRRLPQNW